MSNSGFYYSLLNHQVYYLRGGRHRQVEVAVSWPLSKINSCRAQQPAFVTLFSMLWEYSMRNPESYNVGSSYIAFIEIHAPVEIIWQCTYTSTGATQKWESLPLCYLGETKVCVLAILSPHGRKKQRWRGDSIISWHTHVWGAVPAMYTQY